MIFTTILTSSKQIFVVSIIVLQISLFFIMIAISPFAFFFFYTLSSLIPYLLLMLSCSHTKERLLKDYRQSRKYSEITLTFSFFVSGRDIRLVDILISIQIGICWLTDVIFIVRVGNLIVNISPIQQRFVLDIVEANRVDIFINYRAASAD